MNINPEINLKYFEKLNVFFKDISYNDNLKNLLSQYTLLQNDHSKRIETKYEEILSITKRTFLTFLIIHFLIVQQLLEKMKQY